MDGDRDDAGAARAHLDRGRRASRIPWGVAVDAPRWTPASRDVPSALARVDGGEDALPRSRFSRIEEPRGSDVRTEIGRPACAARPPPAELPCVTCRSRTFDRSVGIFPDAGARTGGPSRRARP